MARIRTLKPEFWSHPVLSRLSDTARLMAIALLNYADDEGYFLGDPALVRNFARPFDPGVKTTQDALHELGQAGFVNLVQSGSHGLIGRVVNFTKHQVINKSNPSKIKDYIPTEPLPDDSGSTTVALPSGREQGTGKGTGKGKAPAGHSRSAFASSLLALPRETQEVFGRIWAAWPAKGWNFSTKSTSSRRTNAEEAAQRFGEILEHCRIAINGERLKAEHLEAAAMAYLEERKAEQDQEGLPAPNVCGPAVFFSTAEGQKHPWKTYILKTNRVLE